jgi:hypothetical protein
MSIEDQVTALFVAANPVPEPERLDPLDPPDPLDDLPGWGGVSRNASLGPSERSRLVRPRLVPLVAVAVAMALVGLTVWLYRESRSADQVKHDAAAPVTDGPTLLAPPDPSGPGGVVNQAAHDRSAPGYVRGAVRTPSGEIIGVTAHGDGGVGTGIGGTTTIGGQEVFFGKGPGDVRWAYSVPVGESCFWVRVTTTAGLDAAGMISSGSYLPSEVQTFFEHLTVTGETVTVRLPPGWESLGAAAESDRYTLYFVRPGAPGTVPEFMLDQRPNTGVGVFLSDPRSTDPRPTTVAGREAWLMTGSGQWTTVVFDHDGIAVSLSGRGVNEEQLVAFAAELEPRPWSETVALFDGSNPRPPPVEGQFPEREPPLPADCDVSIELGEQDPTTPTASSP